MRDLSVINEPRTNRLPLESEQVVVWSESNRPAWVRRFERPVPAVRASGMAFLLFEKPDLTLARRFFEDFGLITVEQSNELLRMRGTGDRPFIYLARRGATSRYVGVGLEVDHAADLDRLIQRFGAVPSLIVGEGVRAVQMTDPAGFEVHVLHGWPRGIDGAEAPDSRNGPSASRRVNRPLRPTLAAASVVQCSHVVLQVCDFAAVSCWYVERLGLLPSDVQVLSNGEPNLVFLRLDRGAVPTDHHTIVIAGGVENAYMHSAYEVSDLDTMGQGQQHLRSRGWRHSWGMGRHYLGSQLFDYWFDPFGHEVEHMADSDRFDAGVEPGYSLFDRKSLWMWGQDLPRHMAPPKNPLKLLRVAHAVLTGRLDGARVREVVRAMSRRPRSWLS
jgi:hypothetical protein